MSYSSARMRALCLLASVSLCACVSDDGSEDEDVGAASGDGDRTIVIVRRDDDGGSALEELVFEPGTDETNDLMTAIAWACDTEIRNAGFDSSFVDGCTNPAWLQDPDVHLTSDNWRKKALRASCEAGHYMTIASTVAPLYIYFADVFAGAADESPGIIDNNDDVFISPIGPDSPNLPEHLSGLDNPVIIPPQVPRHQGTAALVAFDRLQTSVAWTGLVLNPSVCTDADLAVPANLVDQLTATLAEAVMNLEEAAETAVDRLSTTAEARRSEEPDFTRANVLRWRAFTDSRLDAARTAMLIPTAFFERPTSSGQFPVVTAAPQSMAQERAYHLLRRARVNPALRGNDLQAALLAALNWDYPSTDGTAFDDATDVLNAFSLSPQDLDRAMLRHEQELTTLGLEAVPDPTVTSGPARYLNLDRPTRPTFWAYHYAMLEGSMQLGHPTTSGLTTGYAKRGLAHALDFAHYVVHRIRGRDLGSAQETVDATWAWLEAQVQDRARVCHDAISSPSWRFHVTFHDAPVVAADDQGASRFRVFRGEAGLECAMTGSIGNVACNATDWEVPATRTILAGGPYDDHGSLLAKVELDSPVPLVGERVYFTWDRDPLGQSRDLLLGITVTAPPSGGGTPDSLAESSERHPGTDIDDLETTRDEERDAGPSLGTRTPDVSCHFIPLGPALQRSLAVLGADPSDPSESRMSCAGVPADVKVKLEDEITEMFTGRDEIESSVATSLRTARASADEAERLGEALFNAQLAFDEHQSSLELRELALEASMNEVAGELTGLCGGYIDPVRLIDAACADAEADCDLAAFISSALSTNDTAAALMLAEETASDLWGLRSCLGLGPEGVDWVAAGQREMCAFKPDGYPVCTCLQSDCGPCPVVMTGTASVSSCTEALGLDELVSAWGSCSGGTGVEEECTSSVTTLGDLYAPYPVRERLNLNAGVSSSSGSAACEAVLANDPTTGTYEDLIEAMECAADAYSQVVDGLYMADVPLDVAADIRAGLASGIFPTHRGEYGAQVAGAGAELQQIAQLTAAVSQQLVQAAFDVQLLETKLAQYDLQEELAALAYEEQLAVNAAECVGSIAIAAATAFALDRDAFGEAAEAAMTCMIGVIEAGFAAERLNLQEQLSTNAQAQAIIATLQQLVERMDTLENAVFPLQQSFARLNQHMAKMEVVRTDARRLINQLGLLQKQKSQPDAVVNRAYSYRIQRLQYQYDNAMRRAKRDSLLALRAIEQRIGMRLAFMDQDMAFGLPAPQTWVHRICSTSGIDYDLLRDEDNAIPDGYDPADGHIGEVVSLLEDFLEAYRYDYPFDDHRDTVVISLREDVLGLVDWCEQPQPNLLLGTGVIGAGWFSGCSDTQCGVVTDTSAPDFTFPGSTAATPVHVATLGTIPAPMGAEGSGRAAIEQSVTLEPGTYTLSWYGPGGNGMAPFVEDATSGADVPFTVSPSCPPSSGTVWGRCQAVFDVGATATMIVGFEVVGSDAQLLAPQLEAGFGASAQFHATDEDLTAPLLCSTDGEGGNVYAALDHGIEYYCPDGTGLDCADTGAIDPDALPSRPYVSVSFPLDVNLIESGAILERTGFAIGNFNYRHRRVGVWIDGGPTATYCPPGEDGLITSCPADTHVNWSLFHTGPFFVRNYENDRFDAQVYPGVIRQARGGIASGPLRDPIAQTDGTLRPAVEELMVDFNGRPFEGNVELRIYDTDHLNLEAIRDVQLVVEYTYWTRSTH